MTESKDLLSLTAGDLMNRNVLALRADMPLREAARELIHAGVRGAPVVDDMDHCVGVFSVSDIARRAAQNSSRGMAFPRSCGFQQIVRSPHGGESIMCMLAAESCPYQRVQEQNDGHNMVMCMEPHAVPTDWQMVDLEVSPGDTVQDVMTTEVVMVDPETPVPDLARVMLDRGVHRLVVTDALGHPIGLVAVDELLQILAHPELVHMG
jgi:CBS domain-containing protein